MGEAKKRGNFEDRVNHPKKPNFDKMSSAEIKDFFDMPSSAEFKGYVIHSVKRDDFLASLKEDRMTIRRTYSPTPEKALIFESYKSAEKTAQKVPPEWKIGLVFDHENMLNVYFMEYSST